ncbi:MAG: hypothetical protein JSV08_10110 [Acidobacteriota bacterium]|nr:MAG: hypothetical protein JSV08_10110 [Acidobacteriota bacterium]
MKKQLIVGIGVLLIGALQSWAGVSIEDDSFMKKGLFQGKMLGDDWSHKKGGGAFSVRNAEITFYHKKSNGWISVNSFSIDEDYREKPVEANVENFLWINREIELSRKSITVDGHNVIWLEAEDEKKYYKAVNVYVRLSDEYACWITYGNTPSFFSEFLSVFEGFLQDFKILTDKQ